MGKCENLLIKAQMHEWEFKIIGEVWFGQMCV